LCSLGDGGAGARRCSEQFCRNQSAIRFGSSGGNGNPDNRVVLERRYGGGSRWVFLKKKKEKREKPPPGFIFRRRGSIRIAGGAGNLPAREQMLALSDNSENYYSLEEEEEAACNAHALRRKRKRRRERPGKARISVTRLPRVTIFIVILRSSLRRAVMGNMHSPKLVLYRTQNYLASLPPGNVTFPPFRFRSAAFRLGFSPRCNFAIMHPLTDKRFAR